VPWWKGARGEWYVVIQVALILLVLVGPRTWPGGPLLALASRAWSAAAVVLIVGGLALVITGGLWLGRKVTPLPSPVQGATLVDSGPFRLVRHPMYSGGVLFAFGWAIYVRGPLTVICAAVLLAFADIKARREERWLNDAFPGYEAYRRCVRRLVPFVY
jgi:protein-S-isoprenylcysteine O-methyltransferase Ste14